MVRMDPHDEFCASSAALLCMSPTGPLASGHLVAAPSAMMKSATSHLIRLRRVALRIVENYSNPGTFSQVTNGLDHAKVQDFKLTCTP